MPNRVLPNHEKSRVILTFNFPINFHFSISGTKTERKHIESVIFETYKFDEDGKTKICRRAIMSLCNFKNGKDIDRYLNSKHVSAQVYLALKQRMSEINHNNNISDLIKHWIIGLNET